MSQKCPACGVNNPPRAKACAHCQFNFQTQEPGRQPVEPKVMAPQQQTPVLQPVSVPQPTAAAPSLVLEAPFMRLRGLIGTIIMGLMLIPTMLGALSKAPVYPLMFFFSWLLVILLVPQFLLLLRPRRIVVQGDNFLVKGFSGLITPVQNLFLVAHDGVSLCVRFHSLDAVACSPKMKSTMEKTAFRDGHHFTFPGFTFAQAEQLRQALGLPEPPINASLSHVRSYQQEIRTLTPKLFVTKVLVAINVIVYLLMVASGCDWMQPATYDLVQWGANFGPYTAAGQGWRLLTCCFLHIGLMHLAFNMWALLSVGPLMERLLGNTGFLLLYLASGLMGSILSMLWNPTVISAGASGAIFGIFGAMLGFLVLHKESMPVTIYRSVWKSGAAFLAFNLLFAWGVPGIDMAAHVGGAVAGFFGGMVLSQPLDQHTRRTRLWRNALLAGMTVVLLVPAFFYLPVPKGPDADWAVATLQYYRAEEKIIHDYNQLLERIKRKEASEDAMIKLLKEQTLPQWSQWLERMVLIAPTKEPMRSMQPRFITFMRLQKEAWELQLQAVEKQDQAIQDKANAKFAQAARAVQQISPNR